MIILIAEYAAMHGLTAGACKRKALRGGFKTARKMGRYWVIDSDEPLVDNRIKSGDYIGWRKKYQDKKKAKSDAEKIYDE